MENINQERKNKIIFPLAVYWIVFVILPCASGYYMGWMLSSVWYLYLLLIAPILFIVPFKMIGFKDKHKNKLLVIFGLLLPYLLVYLFLYYSLTKLSQINVIFL